MTKLTIGCATFDDFDGVYFSLHAIAMYQNPEILSRAEIVVVDQNPTSKHGLMVQDFMGNLRKSGRFLDVRYIPFSSPIGTSPSRNHIFDKAAGEYVMVVDCHVLLYPGALDSLDDYYSANPNCSDIISGPLVFDDHKGYATHVDDVWGGEMWGRWATAWRCGCGPEGIKFSITNADENSTQSKCKTSLLGMKQIPVTVCRHCSKRIPLVPWDGHELLFKQEGYIRFGENPGDPPFEIPGMGLGLFSSRKEAWLGFNRYADGFGGEELYIHEKYRAAGNKAICIPDLKWVHRFGRPYGVPYPLPRWNKIRNYVLEFQEIGLDLEPLHKEFVVSGLLSQDHWDKLVDDPKSLREAPCNTCGDSTTKSKKVSSLEEAIQWVVTTPRDLDQHVPFLSELAKQCPRVTEFSYRKESTIAFLAGASDSVVSHNSERGQLVDDVAELSPANFTWSGLDSEHVTEIEETDLLFIDTLHTYERVYQELTKFAPQTTRFIVLHDTEIYRSNGEDGGPGIVRAIGDYLKENLEWFVAGHNPSQYGLTVLGKREEDKPEVPVALIYPEAGPGTELKKILSTIGINPTDACSCNYRTAQMDLWGIDGCNDNFDTIVEWLKEGHTQWGWKDKLAAAAKAVKSGLAFKLNPLDPFPSLVRESIKRYVELSSESM